MQIPIESMNLLMLNVGMARHNGDWNWQNVSSPFTRIYYIKEGTARLHLPDKVVELRPDHLYIVPSYTTHSYECAGPFTHYYLHMCEGVKSEASVMDFYDFPTEVEAQEGDEGLFRRMCRQHPQAQLPGSDPEIYDNSTKFTDYVKRYNGMQLWQKMELRGSILLLVSRFMCKATPRIWTSDERMKSVLTYIHSHITQDIDIEKLASLACITKPYLIRLFKREFGTPPVQYINIKKIERAQLLLYTTDMPVKEVAYALGFNDHSYFIRLFRKLSGMTPHQYRKLNAGK